MPEIKQVSFNLEANSIDGFNCKDKAVSLSGRKSILKPTLLLSSSEGPFFPQPSSTTSLSLKESSPRILHETRKIERDNAPFIGVIIALALTALVVYASNSIENSF